MINVYALCVLSDDNRNTALIHNSGVLPKMLFVLSDPSVTPRRVEVISCVITLLLKALFNPLDIHRLSMKIYYLILLGY